MDANEAAALVHSLTEDEKIILFDLLSSLQQNPAHAELPTEKAK